VSCTDTETVGFGEVRKAGSLAKHSALLVLDSAVPGDRLITILCRAACDWETIFSKKRKKKKKMKKKQALPLEEG